MRTARTLAVLLLAAACAREPEDGGWKLAGASTLPKDEPRRVPSHDLQGLIDATGGLGQRIGTYPARFKTEEEREASVREWSEVLLDARVVARPADGNVARMWVLGELYRLGHNLNLRGAAELADDNLSACVAQFPDALSCHESLVALYLSVKTTPERLRRVERSLATLKDSPESAEFAAIESVHLRVVERDVPAAQLAIDEYLEQFPDGRAAARLRAVRPKLEKTLDPPVAEDEP